MLKCDKNIIIFKSSKERAFIVSCPYCRAFRIYHIPDYIPEIQKEKYANDVVGGLVRCNGKGNKDCMRQS